MNPPADSEQRIRVAEFQRKHRVGLLALLFTDMVGSTQLKQDLGDREAVMLIKQHHAIVREILGGFKEGQEISTAGDSFFIVFAKPSDAVKFSLALQSKLHAFNGQSAHLVSDRIGIHVGEVFVEECESTKQSVDLYGIQVDTGARVMSLAQGGQILMTRFAFDNARQVLRGHDIVGVGALSWLNHGPYWMKGVEEPLEICEVGEAGRAPLAPPPSSEKAARHLPPDSEPVLGWRPAVDQFVPNTKWLLKEKLGEGGFGEVWLGAHEVLKKQRVFKFCFRADRVRSLKREVTFFRVLMEKVGEHPNIVGVEDIYFDEPPYYIVMSYAEGKDLVAWSKKQGGLGKVPLAERLEIVAQVADGLAAAHEAGVIHRDVKPSNILITADTSATGKVQVKLTDFGVGQAVSEEVLKGITLLGVTETIVAPNSTTQSGTFMYMPPEFMGGKTASPKSDIYSLGVVLYQMIVGDLSRPLAADWPEEIPCPVLRGDLKRCVARNPDDRLSAGDLALLLRSYDARKAAYDSEQTTLLTLNPPPPPSAPPSDPSAMRFAPFLFSNGAQARSVVELKELCRSLPAEGVARLRDGRMENWLRHCEAESEADRAKAIRESAGDDWEATLDEFLTGTRPFIFRTGEKVTTLEGWFAHAQKNSAEARHQLYTANFEHWLRYRGWTPWAESAAKLRSSQPNRDAGLKELLKQWDDHLAAMKMEEVFRAESENFRTKSRSYRVKLVMRAVVIAFLGAGAGWVGQLFFGLSLGVVHPSPWQVASPLAGCVAGGAVLLLGCFAWLRRWWRWRPHWKAKGLHPLAVAAAKAPVVAREFVRIRRKENFRTFRPVFLLAVLLPPLGFAANGLYGRAWKERLAQARTERESRLPAGIPHRTNSLGMVFVNVPGTPTQFSIWETRRSDFAAFVKANPQWHAGGPANNFSVTDGPNLPVTQVTWDDARAFCQWLTRKESAEGKLPAGATYRLPTDREWSAAVDLPLEADSTPRQRSGKIPDQFPWGTNWPPPLGAGNLLDAYALNLSSPTKVSPQAYKLAQDGLQMVSASVPELKSKQGKEFRFKGVPEGIPGYCDGYGLLAPAGSFAPNAFGLHDLEGNVSEWCEDWFDKDQTQRVTRGGNYGEGERDKLLSSFRNSSLPNRSDATLGFRVVLAETVESTNSTR